jgi:hypothetical protein
VCYSVNWLFFHNVCERTDLHGNQKKSTENHDFYVAKRFFDFHVFFCDDAIDSMCVKHKPVNIKTFIQVIFTNIITYLNVPSFVIILKKLIKDSHYIC